MSNILVTGGSGFLGTALVEQLLKRGHRVYSLSRHPEAPAKYLIPLRGDILKSNLGLTETPDSIDAVHHLAGQHRLGLDNDGMIWETNVDGTKNVISFCTEHNIPHLYFCSTAYTWDVNTYGRSKALCESLVSKSGIPRVTIFKPSIIMGTERYPYPGHFGQFVMLVIKLHQRAEIIRRKIEGTLRLPIIEPVFRVRGNPGGKLNIITVEAVAEAMSKEKKTGTFWPTNPNPPTIERLLDWVGEFALIQMRALHGFKPTPIEMVFRNKAAAFEPYLQGDDFPSDMKKYPPITKEFIHSTIKQLLNA